MANFNDGDVIFKERVEINPCGHVGEKLSKSLAQSRHLLIILLKHSHLVRIVE